MKPIPDRILAHERRVLLPIPLECCHCHAGPAALLDDGASICCFLCGWQFLYLRSEAWTPEHLLIEPRGRGRGAQFRGRP